MIIGAAKSGTSSLADYLGQHPDVFVSRIKEPNYFALAGMRLPTAGPGPDRVRYKLLYQYSVTDWAQYQAMFAAARDERAIGEGSVRYLYYKDAPARIRQALPDVRLVAILRDPVQRLFSHYCMNRQFQLEPLGLEAALEHEQERIAADWGWDWHYASVGMYSEQLARYYALFPREQIKVFLYDEFVQDPHRVYREICEHIGVNPDFRPSMESRRMVPYHARWLALDRWLTWPSLTRRALEKTLPRRLTEQAFGTLKRLNAAPVPRLDPELRRRLAGRFKADGRALSELLGRPIPWAG